MAHSVPPTPTPPGTAGSARANLMTPLSNVKTAPKWSMQGRFRSETNSAQDAPGPGSYGLAEDGMCSKFSKPARFVFGSSLRDSLGKSKNVPGPGAYKVKDSDLSNVTPSYSCTPRRNHEARARKDQPGPGSHNLDSLLGKGTPQWKLGNAERKGEPMPVSPGPAAYNPKDGQDKVPKWSMGTDERKGMALQNEAPGPGSYTVPSRLQDGPKYSVAARRDQGGNMSRNSDTPGPSAYSLTSTVGHGPKSTMSSRDMWNRKGEKQSQAENPGPGAYGDSSMDVVKFSQPKFGFGTSLRDGGLINKKSVPGPGNYTPRDPAGECSLAFGFGTSARKGMGKQGAGATIPGPGTYALANTVGGGGPKVVMTPRRVDKGLETFRAPGPGAYRPDSRDDKSPAWGFGTSQRPGLSQTDASVPAPGTYSHGKALGADGPKFTMGAKVQDHKAEGAGGSTGQPWTQFGY